MTTNESEKCKEHAMLLDSNTISAYKAPFWVISLKNIKHDQGFSIMVNEGPVGSMVIDVIQFLSFQVYGTRRVLN